jgi:hypothetical protein
LFSPSRHNFDTTPTEGHWLESHNLIKYENYTSIRVYSGFFEDKQRFKGQELTTNQRPSVSFAA